VWGLCRSRSEKVLNADEKSPKTICGLSTFLAIERLKVHQYLQLQGSGRGKKRNDCLIGYFPLLLHLFFFFGEEI
jgi:hypothetical protein